MGGGGCRWGNQLELGGGGFPTTGEAAEEREPLPIPGLGGGAQGRGKGHSVGTREFQQAEENVIVLMDTAAPWF